MKAARWGLDAQPLQVNGDNICKVPWASLLQIETLTMNPCCKSKATWFLFQPPVLRGSSKKLLRLKLHERILNLPSSRGWVGSEKVELSHSVTAEYPRNNPIGSFPSKSGLCCFVGSVFVICWLFSVMEAEHRLARQGKRRRDFRLPYVRSRRSSGVCIASDRGSVSVSKSPVWRGSKSFLTQSSQNVHFHVLWPYVASLSMRWLQKGRFRRNLWLGIHLSTVEVIRSRPTCMPGFSVAVFLSTELPRAQRTSKIAQSWNYLF